MLCPTLPAVPCRSELQERYGLASNRGVPDWGRAIFSRMCVIMRPQSNEELEAFVNYAVALSKLHVEVSAQCTLWVVMGWGNGVEDRAGRW